MVRLLRWALMAAMGTAVLAVSRWCSLPTVKSWSRSCLVLVMRKVSKPLVVGRETVVVLLGENLAAFWYVGVEILRE